MTKEKVVPLCNKLIEVSLYILIYAIPFSIAIVESAAITAIIIWCFKKIFIERGKSIFKAPHLNWPILIYISICILSSVFSSNIYLSFRTFIRKTLEYVVLYFIVVEMVRDRRILRNILIVFIIIAGLVSFDGIFQYFRGWDFFRGRGMIIAGRVSGTFIYPGDFGVYLATVIPLSMCILFLKSVRLYFKIALGVILIMLLTSLVLTVSKSAWLAFVISMSIGAIICRKKYIVLVSVFFILLIWIFSFSSPIIKSRTIHFFDLSEGGGSDREMLWQGGWHMFMERPLLGQGLGTYMYNFQRFRPKGYPANWGISYPHNCFLQMAAETGIFGLLAFLWIVSSVFIYSAYLLLSNKEVIFEYAILWGLSVGLVAYLVHSFFDTNLYSLPLATLFWVILGLIVATMHIIEQQHSF